MLKFDTWYLNYFEIFENPLFKYSKLVEYNNRLTSKLNFKKLKFLVIRHAFVKNFQYKVDKYPLFVVRN